MSVQSREEGDVLIIYITEKRLMEPNLIQEIGSQLLAAIIRSSKERVVLNFKAVEFMSTEFLGRLVVINKRCRDSSVDLILCEFASHIMQVIKVMHLDRVLKIKKTEEKALASFDK